MLLTLKRRADTRIILIYLVALSLVIGISILAIIQLNQISTTVNNLTNNLAVERALSKDIVSQVLLTRFYAHQYVRTQSQADLDRFHEEFARLEEFLALADRQIISPERVEMLNHINLAVREYRDTFEEVTSLVKKRQRIYAEVLDIEGHAIENELTALRVHVIFLNDPPVFLASGNAQNAFRLMSLNTSKYLEEGDEKYAVLFEMGYQQAQAALSSLEAVLQDPAQRQNAADAKAAADVYYQGFQTIYADYVRLKELLDTMLDVLEPEISNTASEITTSVEREFKTKNEFSQALISITRLVLLATTTIAILAGLGLGIVLSRYITERLRTEEVLRESEERYRTLFEGTPVGFYRSTPAGQIIDANPALVQMLNCPNPETLLAINAADLYVDTEDRRRWQTLMETDGAVRNFEVQLRRHDGAIILVRNNARVIRDGEDRVLYYEGSLEDITDQVRAEEELRRYRDHLEGLVEERTAELTEINEQLQWVNDELTREIIERMRTEAALEKAKKTAEQANRAKSIFLANMSHELRTPLNAILGFSELMARDPDLTREQQEKLATIGRSGEHLLALVNDVLELSKIEAGRAELQPESFDLHQMLLGLGEMFGLRTEAKDLTLVFDLAPGVPQHIHADRGKLRQVLTNLLGNAVRFTYEGGITLRVGSREYEVGSKDDSSTPLLPAPYSLLHFEVEDTGVGIAPDELDKVFDAFVQTSSGRRSTEGTGLGVPISREFVRIMGGDLTVSSKVGLGTVFQFDVPIEVVDVVEVESAQPSRHVIGLEPGQRAADGGPYRLLVVEDVDANRKLLVEILQSIGPSADSGQGFEVQEAVNGREALEIWEEWKPHLIWMDIRMPVMDGQEASRHIKSTPQGKETVIIALTAGVFEEDRKIILSEGCDDFIRKPVREADIFDALTRHLGVRFVYEEIDREEPEELPIADLKSRISNLPPALLTNLEHTTVLGDMNQILNATDQIRAHDAAVADALARLASDFEYAKILTLIQEAGGRDE